MTGLLYKEFRLNARKLIFSIIGALVYPTFLIIITKLSEIEAEKTFNDAQQEQMLSNVVGIVWFTSCFMAFMFFAAFQNTLIIEDERKKWAYYITSTPTGVNGFIGVKYLMVMLTGMFVVTIMTIMQAVQNDMGILTIDATAVTIMGFFMQLLFRAIEYPLVFRFGTKVGNMVKSCIVVLLCIVIFVYFLFGDTSMFANMETFWDRFFKFVNNPEQMKKVYLWIGIISVAVMPLYYLSYRLSVKWYLKGVENYAK